MCIYIIYIYINHISYTLQIEREFNRDIYMTYIYNTYVRIIGLQTERDAQIDRAIGRETDSIYIIYIYILQRERERENHITSVSL